MHLKSKVLLGTKNLQISSSQSDFIPPYPGFSTVAQSYQDIIQSYPDNILVLPWPIVWHKSSATYQYRLTKTKYRLTKATSLTKTPIPLECYPHPSHRTSVQSVQISHISKIHKNESVKVCHFSWVKAFVAGLNTHLSIAESIEVCQGVVK